MTKNTIILIAIVGAIAACATNPQPVPLEGNRASLAALAGEWAGSYVGRESGRSGSIIFVLEADGGAAAGDVLMIPRRLYQRSDTGEAPAVREVTWPEAIGIRFVHVESEGLYGLLDEYRDPECGCRLETSFRGSLTGDRIEGTFLTRHLDGGEQHSGTWHVERSEP